MFRLVSVVALTLAVLGCCHVTSARDHREPHPKMPPGAKVFTRRARLEDRDYWFEEAAAELAASLAVVPNTNVARNVILFLGDGMSVPTITAGRIYKGQQSGQSGEEYKMVWEDFPDLGMIKTYTVDKQVPDSASTATAYLCGAKTNYYLVGVDASAQLENCTSINELNKLSSVAQWALEAGKRTGFVTSTRVYHATPSALYAHSATRDWECDSDLDAATVQACPDVKDIARQLVEDYPGRDFNVIMGGGHQGMTRNATSLPGDPINLDWGCLRSDDRDLFQLWQEYQAELGRNYAAVRTLSQLEAVNLDTVDYLMGIYANDHVPYEHEKRALGLDLPTLAEMTEAALTLLMREPNGFFLLVEGGRIDLAHHDSLFNTALDETAAFDDAIRKALEMVDLEETLVIVTADHSHVAAINGYPLRGQDITGLAMLADDDLPMATLMYTNGPGFTNSYVVSEDGSQAVRRDISGDDVSAFDYAKPAAVLRDSDTHGGDDVPVFAIGPMSHLFQRTHEQSYIAHVIGYASCTGPNQQHCLV